MQFLLGSKIGEENLWKIFQFKNFFFFGRNIFLKFSLQILEPAKNFMFSFFLCWVFTECFWEDDEVVILFILSKGLSGKKSF